MSHNLTVSVPFTRQTAIGDYADCLYFPFDDFFDENNNRLIDDTAIDLLITARVQTWVDSVTAASQQVTLQLPEELPEEGGE